VPATATRPRMHDMHYSPITVGGRFSAWLSTTDHGVDPDTAPSGARSSPPLQCCWSPRAHPAPAPPSTNSLPDGSTSVPAAGSCHRGETDTEPTPDPHCTPGVTNPDVTPTTMAQTICKSGWTQTIRPPASHTNRLKQQQIAAYGYSDTNPRDYEEDHFYPVL
jgi:hypothetical protein